MLTGTTWWSKQRIVRFASASFNSVVKQQTGKKFTAQQNFIPAWTLRETRLMDAGVDSGRRIIKENEIEKIYGRDRKQKRERDFRIGPHRKRRSRNRNARSLSVPVSIINQHVPLLVWPIASFTAVFEGVGKNWRCLPVHQVDRFEPADQNWPGWVPEKKHGLHRGLCICFGYFTNSFFFQVSSLLEFIF